MMKVSRLSVFFMISLLFIGINARADIAIIVNLKNEVKLSREDIKNIFLAKKTSFSSGKTPKAVDQSEGSPIRQEFYLKLADKTETEMKIYWSNLIFSGYGIILKSEGDDNAVKKFVRETENAIGYIDTKSADTTVQTELILK